MTWKTEFREEYKVPVEIQMEVVDGKLVDTSWHNDTCPSFTSAVKRCEDRLRLWSDAVVPADREILCNRYCITKDDEAMFQTDDIEAALKVFHEMEIQMLLKVDSHP